MPQGYYTIEEWKQPKNGKKRQWVAIQHLPLGESLTAAEQMIEKTGKPGLYRIVQMQRVVWAENESGNLRLRKSHAASPANLDKIRQIFERTGGKYSVEEAREARRRAKKRSDA